VSDFLLALSSLVVLWQDLMGVAWKSDPLMLDGLVCGCDDIGCTVHGYVCLTKQETGISNLIIYALVLT
jgi:hypothetical protein